MASRPMGATIRRIERLFHLGSVAGLSEVQLLERFVLRHDDAAFEALVERHGPMVLGICRQWLRDPSDVEDAFQATFLVLVRKAGSLRDRELLGNWLYGVAYRVALRARADRARRRSRETSDVEGQADPHNPERAEPRVWLHEEVNRLPEKYRAPIVLCYLEGRTHEEAAEQLRWPVGTVKGRLSRARDLLHSRLSRRGLAPSAGLLTAALSRDASAAIPATLMETTVRAASVLASGKGVAAGLISVQVISLMEGVCQTMLLSQLKVIAASFVVAGIVTASAGVLARQTPGEAGDKPKGRIRTTAGSIDPSQSAAAGGSADALPGASTAAANSVSATEASSAAHGVQDRVALARKGLETIKLFQLNHVPVDSDKVHEWSIRLLEAELQASRAKSDRVAAVEGYLARVKSQPKAAEIGSEKGEKSPLDLLEWQFRENEANQWLSDAKADKVVVPRARGTASVSASASAGDAIVTAGPLPSRVAGEAGQRKVPGKATARVGGPGRTIEGGFARAASGGPGGFDKDVYVYRQRIWIAQMAPRIAAKDPAPQTKEILKKLEEPVAMSFGNETPLQDVLKYIKSATTGNSDKGIQFYVDPQGLLESEKTMTSPVSMDIEGVPLRTSLRLMLNQLGLAYCVKDGLVIISSVRGISREIAEVESDSVD